jgi:Ras-related protein Rab-2A
MFKVILIGDQAVGKSSILSRVTGNEFRDCYDATVGVEFGNFIVNYDGKIIKMQIWDTAGMESFR